MRSQARWQTVKEDADKLKVIHKTTTDTVRRLGGMVNKLKAHNDKVRIELARNLTVLNEPARQKKTLKKIVACFASFLKTAEKEVGSVAERGLTDVFSGGATNFRLAPLYTFSMSTGERAVYGRYEAEDEFDEAKEAEIDTWRPGQTKSKEATPCFDLINTRSGAVVRRFANFCILHERTMKGTELGTPLLPLRGIRNSRDSREMAIAPPIANCTPRANVPFKAFEEMADGKNYIRLLDGIHYLSNGVEHKVQDSGQDVRGLPKRFLEHHKNIHSAQMIILHCKYRSKNKIGRFVDLGHLTKLDIPKSEAVLKKETARLKTLKSEEGATGIIVHVMSQYCGQRVHVVDTSDVRSTALMAEMMNCHYKYLVESWVDPIKHTAYEVLEGGNESVGLLHVLKRFGRVCERLLDPEGDSVWGMERREIKDVCDHLKTGLVVGKAACTGVLGFWKEGLIDRAKYKVVSDRIIMCAWQGMCTTVLARKVRTEEDIDDGTFTTVRKEQVDNEFRRFGITDDEEKNEICAAMKTMLKTRIRDVRRIFQFYAAVSDSGGVTELDHQECWKFVKDCRLQRDRKALPSVRVDLIFQSCTIDHSKKGLARVQGVQPELGPTQFVEFMARLASYRYTKGTWPERLEKLINEDVLPNACR